MTDIELSVNGVAGIDMAVTNGDTVEIDVIDVAPIDIEVTGGRGPQGRDAHVYYGTGEPPDPTELPDGALFFKIV